jgi:hypothetical protein
VWVYEHAIDLDGVRCFSHNLSKGLLGQRIERSPLFARHRWVSDPGPEDIDIAECACPRAELSDWADECSRLPIDLECGPGWHIGILPLTDGSNAVSLVISHYLIDGFGLALTIADAVLGNTRGLGYPPPRSRTPLRAVVQDAAKQRETHLRLPGRLPRRQNWPENRPGAGMTSPDHPHRNPPRWVEATAMTLSSCRLSRSTPTWMLGMPVRRLLAERVTRWSPGWLRNLGSA